MGTSIDPEQLEARLAAQDWRRVAAALDADGHARLPGLLAPAACRAMAALWQRPELFRSQVVMARHRFGEGEYRYFAAPLPTAVAALRLGLYRRLAPIANRMSERLGRGERYPAELDAFLARCHAAGQRRPTPLLLRYEAGGYNRLHRDLYGPLAFPLQATVALSRRGRDFDGGAFLLLENRARMQSRGEAIDLDEGELVVFPVAERPLQGPRGTVRAQMRHGVSRLTRGERYALGLIFHDAA